jgi:four helix bundle protein
MSYLSLNQLTVYKLSCEYSEECWKIYKELDWREKHIIGDQMIRGVDSVGANIAEGYGRFHYLDKIKFYYNSRGSLFESKHWFDLLFKRGFINQEKYFQLMNYYTEIQKCLNGLINSAYKNKNGIIS